MTMKNSIIYLGIALIAFSSVSLASAANASENQKTLITVATTPDPLSVAISKGELETVKKYIEEGTKVNKKINGMTPLMYAARYNQVEIINYLLQQGAELNIVDSHGYTALKYAELSNAQDAITALKSAPVAVK